MCFKAKSNDLIGLSKKYNSAIFDIFFQSERKQAFQLNIGGGIVEASTIVSDNERR